jgi:hypothetical protein
VEAEEGGKKRQEIIEEKIEEGEKEQGKGNRHERVDGEEAVSTSISPLC